MSEFRLEQCRDVSAGFPGPRSKELQERRDAVVVKATASSLPVYAADVDGAIIRDVDGNQFIDVGAGIAVTTVGASHPKVVAAVQEAAKHFTHTAFGITPYEGYVAVAEKLVELTPGDHPKKAMLVNSGAEAVENAVKIARHATGRDAVVVFDHAFHGRTNLTMGLTAKSMPYKDGFGPFAPEVYRVAPSYPYRDPEGFTGADAAARAIAQIEAQVGGKNVAAILIEPIQGEGGFIVPADGFLPALQQYATDNGIVFIVDEVQAGMARTGEWFGSDHEGIVPDLVTIAKGVGAGMPLSAVVGRAEILDSVHIGGLGGTYAGNPVSCAASLAAIEVMAEEGLLDRAKALEATFFERLGALKDELGENGIIGELRGRGGMLAIEFVEPGTGATTKTPNAAAVKTITSAALAEGVVLLSCGTYGNVIRLLPPLVITDELFSEVLDVIERLVRAQG
ncbi:4-aminobutyrate--2-oxoglutarate transaminase [Pseudoclavibacter chungangensis]|uniref:(S)-3-amino-2-methylpropionate transaminase n=1 Tax=Pseudoclavibacter chungangensis TaxID=587635 RepID=A0A7J5BM62_9MICO|nr:4-aminobutyrate--2-oxoglutarate transaminase [Pseudoclavibacter chungangensis]KAB1652223.1 4-aminobutyrate--2-oxoglutarate transaminase [Pseudoclavibacter chungangensis]NYJ67587.1 4-aminobutyrate aminotransferase/(S)-3-amino-2-methylpropionate transaminase [Pseudoclavibacter chungangensis]